MEHGGWGGARTGREKRWCWVCCNPGEGSAERRERRRTGLGRGGATRAREGEGERWRAGLGKGGGEEGRGRENGGGGGAAKITGPQRAPGPEVMRGVDGGVSPKKIPGRKVFQVAICFHGSRSLRREQPSRL